MSEKSLGFVHPAKDVEKLPPTSRGLYGLSLTLLVTRIRLAHDAENAIAADDDAMLANTLDA